MRNYTYWYLEKLIELVKPCYKHVVLTFWLYFQFVFSCGIGTGWLSLVGSIGRRINISWLHHIEEKARGQSTPSLGQNGCHGWMLKLEQMYRTIWLPYLVTLVVGMIDMQAKDIYTSRLQIIHDCLKDPTDSIVDVSLRKQVSFKLSLRSSLSNGAMQVGRQQPPWGFCFFSSVDDSARFSLKQAICFGYYQDF